MAPRNGSPAENNVELTDFIYPRDIPDVGSDSEREPLAHKTGEDVKNLSRLHVFWNDTREIAQRNNGFLLIAAGEAFFAVTDAIVKTLQKIDPPVPTSWPFEWTIIYLGCMIHMFVAKIPDPFLGPKAVRVLLFLRGIGGSVGLFGIYYSLQYLSLSDATVLTFFTPTCTAIAGAIFLGESLKLQEAMAGFVSFAGVVLIARPAALFGDHGSVLTTIHSEKMAAHRMKAVAVSLTGVLGATVAYTSISVIGKRAHPMHAMAFYATVCVPLASVGMIITQTKVVIPTQPERLGLLAMIGIFSFLGQILLTTGLQRETASRGTLALYSKIVFAIMLQRILFNTLPSYLSLLGTFMIVAAALYIVLTKEKTKVATADTPIRLLASDDEALEQGLDLEHSSLRIER
ncbi:hypothetical protein M413DRAFT_443310 [Hebeloma cylindrosporum]|uniref:EamA domain-containing protein n=1 Tax=Hebeloma cylindrosporum TaxID=76867 RepID=A0A0C2YTH0_HEBCY|nr:hypothetical protein M413DRAFT_443310 [Hebeloma cylindrosporum h7]